MIARPVVAFDLATCTGYAVWSEGRLLTSGAVRLGKVGEPWRRLRDAHQHLANLLGPVVWGAGEVVYERPLSSTRGRAAAALFAAHQLEAALILACISRGIREEDVTSYAVSTVKKHATGNGRAKKPEVLASQRERWCLPDLTDDNTADALAVLSLHLERRRA